MTVKSCILIFIVVTSIAISGQTNKRKDKRINSIDSTIEHLQKQLFLDTEQTDRLIDTNNVERGVNDDAELIPLLKQNLDRENKKSRQKKIGAKKKSYWNCGFCDFRKYDG